MKQGSVLHMEVEDEKEEFKSILGYKFLIFAVLGTWKGSKSAQIVSQVWLKVSFLSKLNFIDLSNIIQ